MELLWRYLRERVRVIFAFLLFGVIFAVVFLLYRLPVEAAVYPSLLCALFAVLFASFDFNRVRRKHRELLRIGGLTAALIDDLPDTGRIDDEDYGKLIRALQAEVRELETASQARYRDMTEYYTVWVHQIKTPIASMRLQLQDVDTEEARRLRADLFRIEQYVEMVLMYLRMESESSDYVFREHSLDPIIRQAVRKFSHEFIGRRISLQYEPVTETIVTDDKWLSFVLEQLLSNALKYTREGGCVKIYLTGARILCVEDNGIGIAGEDLPRIFEKGYTGCNGRIDRRASGIGLYLCKRVCDNLGIGIRARSLVGEGTTIELDISQYPGRAG